MGIVGLRVIIYQLRCLNPLAKIFAALFWSINTSTYHKNLPITFYKSWRDHVKVCVFEAIHVNRKQKLYMMLWMLSWSKYRFKIVQMVLIQLQVKITLLSKSYFKYYLLRKSKINYWKRMERNKSLFKKKKFLI